VKEKFGSNILIKIPLMRSTNSILVEFGDGGNDNFYEWKPQERSNSMITKKKQFYGESKN
jgi:hypothetical protein